jgi:uncharacterized protein (TIGR02996 family)
MSISSEEKGLLQTIIDTPHDDAPRLVYADWLDDHGQSERAEFIRVQIELERLPGGDPRRPALEKRERQILRAHGKKWQQEISPARRHVGTSRAASSYLP